MDSGFKQSNPSKFKAFKMDRQLEQAMQSMTLEKPRMVKLKLICPECLDIVSKECLMEFQNNAPNIKIDDETIFECGQCYENNDPPIYTNYVVAGITYQPQ